MTDRFAISFQSDDGFDFFSCNETLLILLEDIIEGLRRSLGMGSLPGLTIALRNAS